MQKKYVHVQELEYGDRVRFVAHPDGSFHDSRVDDDEPVEFNATVLRITHSSRFGPCIVTNERFGPKVEDAFYLRDDWTVTHEGLTVIF